MSIIKQQSCNLVWYRNADVFNNPVFTYRPGYETWHAYNKYSNKVGINLVDRSGCLKMPITTTTPDCLRIPKNNKPFNLTYADCCRQRARELLDHSKNINKQIVVLYSGGIDSSTIVSAFLDVCDDTSDFERVIVAHNEMSIVENPSLYNLFKNKFEKKSSEVMNFLFDGRFIIVHGECNDQLFGSAVSVKLSGNKGYDILKQETSVDNLINLIGYGKQMTERECSLIVMNIFKPLMDSTDIDLSKLYYLLWYINFTLKWQNVYYRICAIDSYKFGLKNLYTHFSFFNTNNFQLWTLNNLHRLIDLNDSIKTYKQTAKDYIYTISKDEDYKIYKEKKGSLLHVYKGNNVINQIFVDDSRSSEPLGEDSWNDQNSFV